MINDLKQSGEWKIHVTMKMNFMSSKENEKNRLMHSKSYNRDDMTGLMQKNSLKNLLKSYRICIK